jgi:hypothetical protein
MLSYIPRSLLNIPTPVYVLAALVAVLNIASDSLAMQNWEGSTSGSGYSFLTFHLVMSVLLLLFSVGMVVLNMM